MKIEQKVDFYIIPEEFLDKELSEDEWKQYKVEEKDIKLSRADKNKTEICVSTRTYQKRYWCGDPPVSKWGNCTEYHGQVSGDYCHTTCESAYNVCNRP